MLRGILESKLATRLQSHQGDTLAVELEPPANDEDLRFDEECLRAVPSELREFLQFSNGCNFFGVSVLSSRELYCTEDDEIVFHDWGTGDVTAIDPRTGGIIYRGHDPFDRTAVAASLAGWFQAVYEEIKSIGYLSHPEHSYSQGRYSLYYPAPTS